jgi:hypothetical protein
MRRRVLTTALVVVSCLAVPTSATAAAAPDSVACTRVTASVLNDWIRTANAGTDVTERVSTGRQGCAVAVGAAGLVPLTGTFSLTAVGADLTLSGGGSVFDVRNGGVLAIDHLTLTGATSGAVVNNYGGTATVDHSVISGNKAFFGGGLVNSGGRMTVNDTTVTGNESQGQGGGVGNSGVSGYLLVTGSRIIGNNGLYGAGLTNAGATTVVVGSEITDNHSNGAAAGIVNSSGSLTVIGSTIARNLVSNCPGPSLCGGGFTNAGNLTIVRSRVLDHNDSGIGNLGGGRLEVTDTVIAGNSAPGPGAGVINGLGGLVTIKDSVLTRNHSDDSGGAVANTGGGVITVEHSQVTGNSAAVAGGGLANLANGLVRVTDGTFVGRNAPDDCAGAVDGCVR